MGFCDWTTAWRFDILVADLDRFKMVLWPYLCNWKGVVQPRVGLLVSSGQAKLKAAEQHGYGCDFYLTDETTEAGRRTFEDIAVERQKGAA